MLLGTLGQRVTTARRSPETLDARRRMTQQFAVQVTGAV